MNAENNKIQRFSTLNARKVINLWFSEHYLDSPEKLRQNKTWQVIKKGMIKMGHYRAKARGKPDASYLDRASRMANQNNEPDYGN